MRGMRTMAQSIQKKYVQPAQPLFRFRWNFAEIRKVSSRSKAEAMNDRFSMYDFHRLKACAKKFHRSVETVHLNLGDPAKFVVRFKNIAKNTLQAFSRGFMRIQRYLSFALEAERTHVVQSQDMVSVGMRVQDGVNAFDALANGLLAEIRRGIDQHGVAVILH